MPRTPSKFFEKLKIGDEVEVEVKKTRNIRFHRKFFMMLKIVFDNQDVFEDVDFMREELTKAAGYYDAYKNHKGTMCYRAKSISFGSMDQDTFDDFYNAFLKVVYDLWQFNPEESDEFIEYAE